MSININQIGAGSIAAIIIPPKRNHTPINIGNTILLFLEILETANDPIKVPIECAKKGNIKYFISQFIAFIASKLSVRGKILSPMIINPMLIIIPMIIPEIIMPIFLIIFFMFNILSAAILYKIASKFSNI